MIGKEILTLVTSQIPRALLDNKSISANDFQAILDAFLSIVEQKHIQLTAINVLDFAQQVQQVLEQRKTQSSIHQAELNRLIRSTNLYLEAACIADDVYAWLSPEKLVGQWERSSDFGDIAYKDPVSGLRSQLYTRTINGRKEYIYATAGTVTLKDMANNLTQLDGTSIQYAQSIKNARELSARIAATNGTLLFTGHSLGGGEAVCNALATNRPAIVFNPAGVTDETKQTHGITLSKGDSSRLITSIISHNDPLSIFQDAAAQSQMLGNAVPNAEGTKYYVHYDEKYLNAHSMAGIKDSLKRLASVQLR